jgi:hypothetical protein
MQRGLQASRGLLLLAVLAASILALTPSGAGAGADKKAPTIKLTHPASEDVSGHGLYDGKDVRVRVHSNERAVLLASGWIMVGSQRSGIERLQLFGTEGKVSAGGVAELRLGVSNDGRVAVAAATQAHRKAMTKVVVAAIDAAGNRAQAVAEFRATAEEEGVVSPQRRG